MKHRRLSQPGGNVRGVWGEGSHLPIWTSRSFGSAKTGRALDDQVDWLKQTSVQPTAGL
jgi:hypothetical protein